MFISPDVGWLQGLTGVEPTTTLYHTVDGGRTWTQEAGGGTGSAGGYELIGFLDAQFGWRQQFATGRNGPYTLELTENGGVSWTSSYDAHPGDGCEFATDVFSDPTQVFAAITGLWAGPLLSPLEWKSTNGAQTWQPLTLPPPTRESTAAPYYGLPAFFAGVGVLPVLYGQGPDSTVAFYRSADYGGHWSLVSTIQVGSAGQTTLPGVPGISPPMTDPGLCGAIDEFGSPAAAAEASAQVWWVLGTDPTGARTVSVTTDGGASWSEVTTPQGVPTYPQPVVPLGLNTGEVEGFSALNSSVAWLSVLTGPENDVAPQLLQTTDGGYTWAPVSVPTTT